MTRTVMTYGTFDVVHIGHINLLRRARALGREQKVLQVADDVRAATVEFDELATFGHIVGGAERVIQLRSVLVEVGDFQPLPHFHFAAIRRQLAQQQAYQRSLARAIGADDADPVAAHDGSGEIPHDSVLAETQADVACLEYLAAGCLGVGQLHACVANRVASLRALVAQCLELAHASLVAGSACLDTLADPDFFLRQLFVEGGMGQRFGMRTLLAAAQVIVVVARPVGQLPTIDLDDACCQFTQESTVMGDEHDAAGKTAQEFLQPADGFDVQMIGWLIQQQHVRRADQCLGQQYATFHATRKRCEIRVAVQAQA